MQWGPIAQTVSLARVGCERTIDYSKLGLPTLPEPSTIWSHSAGKHAVLELLSQVSISKYVPYLNGYSSLKG